MQNSALPRHLDSTRYCHLCPLLTDTTGGLTHSRLYWIDYHLYRDIWSFFGAFISFVYPYEFSLTAPLTQTSRQTGSSSNGVLRSCGGTQKQQCAHGIRSARSWLLVVCVFYPDFEHLLKLGLHNSWDASLSAYTYVIRLFFVSYYTGLYIGQAYVLLALVTSTLIHKESG